MSNFIEAAIALWNAPFVRFIIVTLVVVLIITAIAERNKA